MREARDWRPPVPQGEQLLKASPGDGSGRNPAQTHSRAEAQEMADIQLSGGCQGAIGRCQFPVQCPLVAGPSAALSVKQE